MSEHEIEVNVELLESGACTNSRGRKYLAFSVNDIRIGIDAGPWNIKESASGTIPIPEETVKEIRKVLIKECCEKLLAEENFKNAWERKKEEGYHYGPDALENVQLGFEIAAEWLEQEFLKNK